MRSQDPLAGFKGLTSKGRGERGWEGRVGEGKAVLGWMRATLGTNAALCCV